MTHYIFSKKHTFAQIVTWIFRAKAKRISQILILVNLGVLWCCDIITDHPLYLHHVLEIHEEN